MNFSTPIGGRIPFVGDIAHWQFGLVQTRAAAVTQAAAVAPPPTPPVDVEAVPATPVPVPFPVEEISDG